jgi:hypothetical protein
LNFELLGQTFVFALLPMRFRADAIRPYGDTNDSFMIDPPNRLLNLVILTCYSLLTLTGLPTLSGRFT